MLLDLNGGPRVQFRKTQSMTSFFILKKYPSKLLNSIANSRVLLNLPIHTQNEFAYNLTSTRSMGT